MEIIFAARAIALAVFYRIRRPLVPSVPALGMVPLSASIFPSVPRISSMIPVVSVGLVSGAMVGAVVGLVVG